MIFSENSDGIRRLIFSENTASNQTVVVSMVLAASRTEDPRPDRDGAHGLFRSENMADLFRKTVTEDPTKP